eukprot:tig00000470_g1175.t1
MGPAEEVLVSLQPTTTYSCWAIATSWVGPSQDSNSASATTDDSPQPTLTTTAVNATAVWWMSSCRRSTPCDGVYRHVDTGRAHRRITGTRRCYLTPADSKESESKQARTGPPAPQLSLGYKTEFDLRVDLAETDLNKLRVSETFLLRNSSRVCSEASDNWLASCVDGTGAINPGITYEYTAHDGVLPACTFRQAPNTFSIPKEDEFEDCITLTGLEPATTSNITAYYTTTGLNSPTSDVLQVTQASPAAPKLYVSFEPAYPNATADEGPGGVPER